MNEQKFFPVVNQAILDADLALQLFRQRKTNSFLEKVKSSNLELYVLLDSLDHICEKTNNPFYEVSSFLVKNSVKLFEPDEIQKISILHKLETLDIDEWWSNLESLYAIECNFNWIITEQPENFRGNHDLRVYTVEDISTVENILFIRHYKIVRYLSEGGFGKTYLIEDTYIDTPAENRRVIKQLKPVEHDTELDEIIKENFQKEAKILEKLGKTHPQIPTLYGYFEQEDNFYLVQEYIEGKTLDQVIAEKGTLEETEVKGILENLVKVLDYLQENRVIHRDIKPANIILRESDGKPVLIDFGTMKQSMGTTLTTSGNNTRSIVIGTPGFMPPEQMIGRPVFASDIYALGLTGIYLLTGKRPEELETDPETGQLLWEKEAPNVSTGLAQILNQAIASQAKERFTKAKLLAEALENPQASVAKPAYPTTHVSTPPVEVSNIHPTHNDNITQVSQVVSQTNSFNKTLSMIFLLVTFLAGIVGITTGVLNVMRFLDEIQKEQMTIRPMIPKPTCSSPHGSGSIWYAVAGDGNALSTVKGQYCGDALIIGGNTQAASFTSRQQAENFAQYLRRETGYSFWVKEPRIVEFFAPPPVSSVPPSLRYRSTCGDPFVSGATWYVVVGNRTTLGTVKSDYCGDVIINRSGNTQVASFTSRSRAENFARKLENATGMNFWVK